MSDTYNGYGVDSEWNRTQARVSNMTTEEIDKEIIENGNDIGIRVVDAGRPAETGGTPASDDH